LSSGRTSYRLRVSVNGRVVLLLQLQFGYDSFHINITDSMNFRFISGSFQFISILLQIRSDQISSGRRKPHQFRSVQVNSDQISSIQIISGQFSFCQLRPDQISSGQYQLSVEVRSGRFSSSQFSSVQFTSVQFSSRQFISVQFSSAQFSSVQFKGRPSPSLSS